MLPSLCAGNVSSHTGRIAITCDQLKCRNICFSRKILYKLNHSGYPVGWLTIILRLSQHGIKSELQPTPETLKAIIDV